MSDHSEPCYSHEIFVPREIIFEICTVADHLKYWWPEAENAITQTVAPSQVVYALQLNTGDTSSRREVTLVLHDLAGSARIDVHQSHLTNEEEVQQAAKEWQQRIAALESYLSRI